MNCRSVVKKQADITELLQSHNIDILCLTETWLRPDLPDAILLFPGYTLFRRDRQSTNAPWSTLGGGGVAVLVRQGLSAKLVPRTSRKIECLTIEITLPNAHLLVTVAYRSPRQPMQEFVDELMSSPQVFSGSFCILAGDFNAKNSDWNTLDQTDSNGRILETLLTKVGLDPVNKNCGTRPTLTSNPLLDLIFTNAPHLCTAVTTLDPLSDHCPVVSHFCPRIQLHRISKQVEYKKVINYQKLRFILETEPLMERVQGDTHLDHAWEAWHSHFREAVDRSSTWKRSSNRPSKEWFTPTLRRLQQRQNRLYRHSRRHPHDVRVRSAYVICRNHYRLQLRQARCGYIDHLASRLSHRCKRGGYVWWRRAKRLCNISRRKSVIPNLCMNDEVAKTPAEKASLLGRHFAMQCTSDASTTPSYPFIDSTGPTFSLPEILIDDVYKDLLHLSPHKSTSDKEVVPILRVIPDLLCESLTYLFNRSLATATFPSAWKCATVVPIFKNRGNPEEPTNYRPISLLTAVSRIFECRISTSFNKFLVDNKIISPQQFAYLPNKSTTDQLILLTHRMASLLDKKINFDCAFLDFHKAFDQVHHPTLLQFLQPLVDSTAFRWFQSYLDNRRLQVLVDNSKCEPYSINCGVPQGSHLGPSLFLIFINSLPRAVEHSEVMMFADDVALLHPHNPLRPLETNIKNLESDLISCQQWARKAHGKFSSTKTSVMSNYSLPENRPILMDTQPVIVTNEVIHLGITLKPSMSFDDYFKKISGMFRQRVNLLCFMSKHLSPATIMLLYKSYVRPIVEYSIPVWCFRLSSAQLSILDVLQARVCRIYLKSKKQNYHPYETKEHLNAMCDLESLHYRRQMLSLVCLFKFIHNHPTYLHSFSITLSVSDRRPNKLVFHSHGRLTSSLFLPKIGMLWNCLPPRVTKISSLGEFRKELNLHMFKYKYHCKGIPS